MSKKSVIWCSHPKHDEILPNGKKRYWKTGPKPSHPKGRRIINESLAEYINKHDERVVNGSSKRLADGNCLCTTCFGIEESNFNFYEHMGTNVRDDQDRGNCGFDNELNSPIDDDHVRVEQADVKMKLNRVFQCVNIPVINEIRNTNQISHAIDQVYFQLKEWSNILQPSTLCVEKLGTLSSLDLSIDDGVWILQHLRELFITSDHKEQQRILSMLPPTWGRDRIYKWIGSSQYQARHSIELRPTMGIFSCTEEHRGNKPLDTL